MKGPFPNVPGVHKDTTPTPQGSLFRCNMIQRQTAEVMQPNTRCIRSRIKSHDHSAFMPRFAARALRPMACSFVLAAASAASLAAFLAALLSLRALFAARVGEGRGSPGGSSASSSSEPVTPVASTHMPVVTRSQAKKDAAAAAAATTAGQ